MVDVEGLHFVVGDGDAFWVVVAVPTAPALMALSAADRAHLMALDADLERAWASPCATSVTKKQIIRTLVDEITVRVKGDVIELVVRWQGGDHSALSLRKNRSGQHRWSTDADSVALARALARQMPDRLIASALNRAGKTTGRGNGWTQSRVCSLRNHHGIEVYRDGERRKRGERTLNEAAETLILSPSSVRRLIAEGQLPAKQFCKGAPWIIHAVDLERKDVIKAAQARRPGSPSPENHKQKTLEL